MRSRLVPLLLAVLIAALAGPLAAQDPDAGGARGEWWASLGACSSNNRPACDRAVDLAGQLFGRTDRDVATTWMKACMAGDQDRCEIGYRRFKNTSFEGDEHPISHMFARVSCYAGMYDLCRPWDDFETTDPAKRALVMADMCMQGASPNTCYRALAFFRDERGFYNAITYDLSETLCERYRSGSACRVWAQALEANWDHRRAYQFHKKACDSGLQESCPDAARLWKRVDYENRQQQAAEEARWQREAAARQASTWRSQAYSAGYTSPGRVRDPITPFGSSERDIANWKRYEYNLCRGNPVNKYC
ncbi:MAG: hypothetical protein CL803_08935 [Citromicrobium sp.]|nr:hypothetical protein [Citromicrobium sp.]MAO96474.1 hypothetical protein [Citromicrobium sp.]MBT47963.1 hypothetical protein [Citromicrobium sp.]|tara:strand:+ start:1031 stop:1945 length:915 start_codon:yes stop_codon:yes gene_type:complete